jgi:glutamate 5-kinase
MEIKSQKYQKIVIKIGSSLLVEEGRVRNKWLENLSQNIAKIIDEKTTIVIVSSGAVALGRNILNIKNKKLTLQEKQACASVGQIELMSLYKNYFTKLNLNVAQILLTASDCNSRQRYLNCKNTIETLLEKNIIPIINENDSVAVDEIKIGDNDRLSARVAQMIEADLMILFSDIDGLYNDNPKINKEAKFIPQVEKINKEIEKMALGAVSEVGTGGMITKILAAKMAIASNCSTIITSGIEHDALKKLISGKKKYTIFECNKSQNKSSKNTSRAKKNWLSGFVNATGSIIINEKASEALKHKKVSLLAVGAIAVRGKFAKGDAVFVKDENLNHIASGISNHNSEDVKKILQKNSSEIKKILGNLAKPELIHINNLFIL